MYFNGAIKFNNVLSSSFGLTVTEPPEIEHSEFQEDGELIPGKDGHLFSTDKHKGSAAINVKMALYKPSNATGYTSAAYQTARRSIWSWLQGTGNLVIGDVSDSHYEVQRVEITSDERELVNYGTIEVKFTVYPYEFLDTPTKQNTTVNPSGSTTFTLTTDDCEPLYEVTTGSGGGTVTINGYTVTVAASQSFNVDIRRRISYSGNTDKSNKISIDYEKAGLKKGSNTISTNSGMTFKIVSSRDGYKI